MTKGEQARLTAWRLKVLQQAADEQNVSRVCRRFGISRKSFYKWKRRCGPCVASGVSFDRSGLACVGDHRSLVFHVSADAVFGVWVSCGRRPDERRSR